jgi:hypothetical protein
MLHDLLTAAEGEVLTGPPHFQIHFWAAHAENTADSRRSAGSLLAQWCSEILEKLAGKLPALLW